MLNKEMTYLCTIPGLWSRRASTLTWGSVGLYTSYPILDITLQNEDEPLLHFTKSCVIMNVMHRHHPWEIKRPLKLSGCHYSSHDIFAAAREMI